MFARTRHTLRANRGARRTLKQRGGNGEDGAGGDDGAKTAEAAAPITSGLEVNPESQGSSGEPRRTSRQPKPTEKAAQANIQSPAGRAAQSIAGVAQTTKSTAPASSSNPPPAAAPSPQIERFCAWRGDARERYIAKWTPYISKLSALTFIMGDTWTIDQHDTIIEYQDELFSLASELIYDEIGVKIEAYNEEDVINRSKEYRVAKGDVEYESLRDYIYDVAHLVNQGDITNSATPKTKIEILINKGSFTERDSILEILLNAERVKNQFIFFLAQFIIHLKKNKDILEKIKDDKALLDLFAERFNSLVKANTLNATTAELRDGMYLMIPIDKANDLYTFFWRTFITRCAGKYYKSDTEILPISDTQKSLEQIFIIPKVSGDDYAFIAAELYKMYTPGVPFDVTSFKTKFAFLKQKPEYNYYHQFAIHLSHTVMMLTQPSLQGTSVSAVPTGQ